MKITYLLGAGASAESLPTVEKIPERITHLLHILSDPKYRFSNNEIFSIPNSSERISKQKVKENFVKDLLNWNGAIKEHSSIDTLAKKLYVTKRQKEYNSLKIVFSFFLVCEQMISKIDRRYDSFLAAISKSNNTGNGDLLPEQMRIISWNYDFQFEKAFSAYSLDNRIDANQSLLNVHPSGGSNFSATNKFGLYKLNGTTGIHENSGTISSFISEVDENFGVTFLTKILKSYHSITKDIDKNPTSLYFAWEDHSISQRVIANAMEATKDTQVLVVIGYSFPFFNREVDRKIIRNMNQTLRKVYFQAPDQEAENYKIRFGSILFHRPGLHLESIKEVKQFFLPPEL